MSEPAQASSSTSARASAPAPTAVTSAPPRDAASAAKAAGRARHQANLKKYAFPLPIFLPASSTSTSGPEARSRASSSSSSSKVEIPGCIGTFDPHTRSVWLTDPYSIRTIFNNGFFGKGSLSRSEPSWRARRVDLLKGGEGAAAEQIREKRRVERKKFKLDRAQAVLDAAMQAEAVLTGQQKLSAEGNWQGQAQELEGTPISQSQTLVAEDEDQDEGAAQRSSSPTPSTSTTATATTTTVIDPTTLTPQTFLVRPTRPDQNRNRGRKAFRRRPPAAATATPSADATAAQQEPNISITTPLAGGVSAAAEEQEGEDEGEEEGSDFDESIVEEMEHLQLGLEEAVFLSLGLGVLKIYDPATETYPSTRSEILSLLLTPPPSHSAIPPTPLTPSTSTYALTRPALRPDDPLLVSYVAYHHYRSLGWVVKSGIKFCADWLLYRKGPAFSHSAFACLMIPVYSDPQDRLDSPHGQTDWYEERASWKWVNTIMRVNSLVQKTVIAVYITIPPLSSFPPTIKLSDGTLDPEKNDLSSLLKRYTIREVSLTRFGPARRRD